MTGRADLPGVVAGRLGAASVASLGAIAKTPEDLATVVRAIWQEALR